MSAKHSPKNIVWTVVEVDSGVPVIVESFTKAATARRRASYLRRTANPNDDVVAVFPSTLQALPMR